jgi:hypothetical protein
MDNHITAHTARGGALGTGGALLGPSWAFGSPVGVGTRGGLLELARLGLRLRLAGHGPVRPTDPRRTRPLAGWLDRRTPDGPVLLPGG